MLTNKQYKNIWILAIVFVFILALIDLNTTDFWNLEITQHYAQVFWTFAFIAIAIGAFMYWIIKRDKSESIAVALIFYGLSFIGLEDFFFYIISQHSLPASMEHLMQHPYMGRVAEFMNLNTVTPLSLIVSIIVGVIIIYYASKYLIRKL